MANVWKLASVKDLPNMVLVSWAIMEASYDTLPNSRHFVGWDVNGHQGYVSSPIKEFDATKKVGKTRSGRIVKLNGPSHMNQDALYVWNIWKRINNVKGEKEISL